MREGNSEVKFLGRTIGMNGHGFYWEDWGLQSCNGVSTPVAEAEHCEESKVDVLAHKATTAGVPPV